jgi:hypothetical protein
LNGKQQYQQATTISDQKTAIAAWQTAPNQLEPILIYKVIGQKYI